MNKKYFFKWIRTKETKYWDEIFDMIEASGPVKIVYTDEGWDEGDMRYVIETVDRGFRLDDFKSLIGAIMFCTELELDVKD